MEQHDTGRGRSHAVKGPAPSRTASQADAAGARASGSPRPASDEGILPLWEDDITEEGFPRLSADPLAPESIQELLHSIPDRADLERLFEKKVTIAQIVQLLGRNVSRHDIQRLIDAADVQGEIRRLLAATADS